MWKNDEKIFCWFRTDTPLGRLLLPALGQNKETGGSFLLNASEMKTSPSKKDGVSEAKWEIADGCLCVRHPDGTLEVPTADQIYRVAVELEYTDSMPPLDSDGTAGGVTFSKYPLLAEIVIEATKKDLSPPLCVTVRAVGEISVPLRGISSEEPDHLVFSGKWYPLAPGALEEVHDVLDRAGISILGPLTLRQYLNLRKLSADSEIIRDESGEAANASQFKNKPEFPLSYSFSGTLFDYQKDGVRWLTTIASQGIGGILADEMGLGKTVQVIVFLVAETSENRRPSLITAPATLLENWRREIGRFAPNLRTLVHRGSDRTGFPSELRDYDTVITSYDTLVRDLSLFRGVDWNILVLDEAQAIKNPQTRRTGVVKRIPRRIGIAVTGTPVENSLSDLWSLMDFVLPGFLGTQYEFEATCTENEEFASELDVLVSPVLLRRRVADVADDLPPRIDIPQALELDFQQAEDYEAVRQSVFHEHGEGKRITLATLMRLRMFCAHPALAGTVPDDPAHDSVKYRRLVEILEEIFQIGEKVILFTSFQKMTDILVMDIPQRFETAATFIDGRTPVEDRQIEVDRFSKIHGGALLVLNPRAAGTGLNITAANHVIHYNPEWNPAVEDQASARAWRRGQDLPVTVHQLFYTGTVEEVMHDRLIQKRGLAEKIEGTEGSEDNMQQILEALRKSPIGDNG